MKIAIACNNGNVSEHFGHCEEFKLFDTNNKRIINCQNIDNPGHKPGFLPNFLSDLGINIIISGGMGEGAITIFKEKGIEVITGASGDAEAVVKIYLNGELKSTETVCHEHEYANECH